MQRRSVNTNFGIGNDECDLSPVCTPDISLASALDGLRFTEFRVLLVPVQLPEKGL